MGVNEQEEIKDLRAEAITKTVFWWSMVVIMAVFGYLTSRVTAMEDKVNDGRVMQATIDAKLLSIQADIAEIKAMLKEPAR